MMTRLAALLVVAVVLSGCSGGDADDDATPTSSSTSTTTGPPPPPPVVYTDTLHLYQAPLISARPPTGTEAQQSDVSADGGPTGGAGGAQWSFTFQGAGTVSGEAHIHVRILQQLVNFGVAPPTLCTWTLTVNVTTGSSDTGVSTCLADPPGLIATGDRELVFSISSGPSFVPGNQLRVSLTRAAFDPTTFETSVYALTGTPEFDSRIILNDLKEPIPPA